MAYLRRSGQFCSQVAYVYDSKIGDFQYGPGHPMQPHRVRMTYELVLHYGLHNRMQVMRLFQSEN